jgi:SAM-dependent methyltransferase
VLERDRVETCERYRSRWLEYGYDPRTLGWTKDCRRVRFAAALEGLRPEDYATVVDLGCGFGDLLDDLRARGWQGRYTGVDLTPELLNEAARRHAADDRATFVCGDFQHLDLPQSDAAIALGVANHRLHEGNLAFTARTVEKMWSITNRVVVCDFLSSTAEPARRRDDLFYADPNDIYRLVSRYSRRIMIHHAYMPFEFQVKVWHDDSFEPSPPVFRPYTRLAASEDAKTS